MTYALDNPPALISFPIAGPGRIWIYRSTDPAATVAGVDYIINGQQLGMQVGDIVIVTDTDTGTAITFHRVAVASTTTKGVTLSAGTAIAADVAAPPPVGEQPTPGNEIPEGPPPVIDNTLPPEEPPAE
jgi:hypothetical protein